MTKTIIMTVKRNGMYYIYKNGFLAYVTPIRKEVKTVVTHIR